MASASEAETRDTPSAAAYGKPVAGLLWATAQLVPSPLLVVDKDVVQSGLRWQLTPLLYSFGIAARPWRTFIVSPIARLSGSVELFVAPEWTCCAGGDRDGLLARAGLRAHFPLIEHGESLAWSLGVSHWRHREGGVSFDLGLYTLFGALGLVATVSPELRGRTYSLALNVRYF
jgi:hypothetical protein